MEFFDKLKATLDTVTRKQFYTYIVGSLVALLFFIMFIMFYYYRSSRIYIKQIHDLNKIRSTEVKNILIKKERIKKLKEKMDVLIAQDPEFVLAQALDELLSRVGLADKTDRKVPPRTVPLDEYSESIVEITLNDIHMKQLVDFLEAVEASKRIYVKKIEISKSKTSSNNLEVIVSLAALVPKQT